MNGIINVLKPSDMTSHDVVAFIRRTLNIKKVGHTGTLDPNAAGILPICVGKATKISQYLIEKKKSYRGELTLGSETDTQDSYGTIINESNISISTEDIIEAFNNFKGKIKQIPPMYSAVKINGKKLYELAREGKEIERKSRDVEIFKLSIIKIKDKKVLFDVECSKGTYVRTLCHDIGRYLESFGHMSFLLRTKVDRFSLEDALTLEEIKNYAAMNQINKVLIPTDYALYQYKSLLIDSVNEKVALNGGKILLSKITDQEDYYTEERIKIYCRDVFLGIGRDYMHNEYKYMKMEKVLL